MFTSLNFYNKNYTSEYTIDTDFIIPNKKLNDVTDLGFFIEKENKDKIIEPLNIFLFIKYDFENIKDSKKELDIFFRNSNSEDVIIYDAYYISTFSKEQNKYINLLEKYIHINPYSIPITYNIYNKGSIIKTKKVRYDKLTDINKNCPIKIYFNFVNSKDI